jgi:hypothetical protein
MPTTRPRKARKPIELQLSLNCRATSDSVAQSLGVHQACVERVWLDLEAAKVLDADRKKEQMAQQLCDAVSDRGVADGRPAPAVDRLLRAFEKRVAREFKSLCDDVRAGRIPFNGAHEVPTTEAPPTTRRSLASPRPRTGVQRKLAKPSPWALQRDQEFALDIFQRLHAVHVQAREDGWTPALLVACANLNLALGNFRQALAALRDLRGGGIHHAKGHSCAVCPEIKALAAAIAAERRRPLRQ